MFISENTWIVHLFFKKREKSRVFVDLRNIKIISIVKNWSVRCRRHAPEGASPPLNPGQCGACLCGKWVPPSHRGRLIYGQGASLQENSVLTKRETAMLAVSATSIAYTCTAIDTVHWVFSAHGSRRTVAEKRLGNSEDLPLLWTRGMLLYRLWWREWPRRETNHVEPSGKSTFLRPVTNNNSQPVSSSAFIFFAIINEQHSVKGQQLSPWYRNTCILWAATASNNYTTTFWSCLSTDGVTVYVSEVRLLYAKVLPHAVNFKLVPVKTLFRRSML